MNSSTCPLCSGTGTTRQDWYPSPVWSNCPLCAQSADSSRLVTAGDASQ